ncbi:hypothetical protein K491DRAFT_675061 [Lophiostoma macrostomum CBS 122681]|uniref:Uncharacterized protein n=1 Tax=Lophiostoma macrostomum CBS 122681 TaxID=1314788 RepID=A0A6A6TN44_9PLEO|nr:hypothetical protein K491DRAFT_675061 [Lophiostoma macrostomum CBS 122681]
MVARRCSVAIPNEGHRSVVTRRWGGKSRNAAIAGQPGSWKTSVPRRACPCRTIRRTPPRANSPTRGRGDEIKIARASMELVRCCRDGLHSIFIDGVALHTVGDGRGRRAIGADKHTTAQAHHSAAAPRARWDGEIAVLPSATPETDRLHYARVPGCQPNASSSAVRAEAASSSAHKGLSTTVPSFPRAVTPSQRTVAGWEHSTILCAASSNIRKDLASQ